MHENYLLSFGGIVIIAFVVLTCGGTVKLRDVVGTLVWLEAITECVNI